VKSISQIKFWLFATAYSIVGNFKQSCSKLGAIE